MPKIIPITTHNSDGPCNHSAGSNAARNRGGGAPPNTLSIAILIGKGSSNARGADSRLTSNKPLSPNQYGEAIHSSRTSNCKSLCFFSVISGRVELRVRECTGERNGVRSTEY